MTAGTQTCARCGGEVPGGADFCLKCGASLKDQARASVALERVRIALAERYPVIRRLGEGGMATVYLARDEKHNRDVAVKVLRPEIALGVGPERFQREIAVAGSLQHPHILSLYDSGEIRLTESSPPVLYYAMPYVSGESLRQRLERTTQLPLEEAVQIAKEVAGALDYAHRQGVVHRDIKPENILLSEGHALVADFGIAAAIGAKGDARITDTGIAIGTPAYMSPEQASGGQLPDGRSDIYSLGCVLYEMLAGEPPYTGPTAQAVISKRFSEPIPALAAVRDVPEEIDAVIRRALARVPADRFATAGQMVLALGARRSGHSAAVPAHQFIATSGVPARPALPLRRRWIVPAAVVVLVLAAVASGVLWRARGPMTGASSTRVAVMPFAYHGSGNGASMGGALVPLLSSVLDGVGTLRAVDPSAVLAATGEGPGSAPDPVHARRIAARLGAGRFVVGDIVEGATDQFTITATAYDAGVQVKRATVEGNAHAQMFRMVNDLAVQLLPAFDIRESPRRLESMSTSSIVALNEYLKGESGRRQGNYPAAADAFGKAVGADSLFALAWFRQAYVLIFSENPGSAEVPMARALALRERLSARDRRLAEALGAEIQVDPEQADRLYRGIVLEYPDDVEGWFGRGDVMLHFGPLAGLAMDSLSPAFERVLFLDPHHSEAQVHLPWAAALDGRRAFVDSVTARLVAQDTGYYAPVWRILGGFARGDSVAVSRAIASQASMDDLQRLLAVNMVATLRDPRGTAWLARALLAAPGREPAARAFGHLMAANLELALGHIGAANRELSAADSLDPAAALEGRALMALMPWLETPDSAIRNLRTRVERWDAASVRPGISNPWVAPHDSLHPQMRLYLLGALSARLQDGEAAQRHAAALLRFDTTTAQGTIGRALAHEILGDLELARGRHAEGLTELDRSTLRGRYARTWQRAYSSPFFSQSYERFQRARALAALGRGAEAARWYGSVWMSNGFDLAFLAPSELALAEIADRAGDTAAAVRHYRAFVARWKDADAPLQPLVARASGRIAALSR